LEERLTSAAEQTLEELKKEGVADDDLEFSAATYDVLPVEKSSDPGILWDCFISFKKASSDDSFLQVCFKLSDSDVEAVTRQEIRKQLKEQNWING